MLLRRFKAAFAALKDPDIIYSRPFSEETLARLAYGPDLVIADAVWDNGVLIERFRFLSPEDSNAVRNYLSI